MTPLNKRVVRKLKESKLQYFAIMVVMMVGILIYIAFNMGIYNFENSVNTYYEKNNLADISAEVVKIPKGNIKSLKKIEGIKNVEGRIKLDVPLKVKNSEEKVIVRVISKPKKSKINMLYELRGDSSKLEKEEIYVIEQFAEGRKIDIGEVLHPQIDGKIYDMEVVAEVASPEYIYLMKDNQSMLPNFKKFGVIYVAEEFASDAFGFGDSYNELIFDVKEGYNLEKVKNKVEKALDKYGTKKVLTKEDQLSHRIVSEEIKGGKQSSAVLPLIFLIVSAVVLTVMINRLVKEDRTNIGVLKSMGYTDIQVLIHYSKFAVFIGLFGSLMGVLIGVLVSKSFTNMYLIFYKVHYVTINYYYGYLISAIFLSIFFSVGAGIMGAKETLKIVPAESMRKKPPKKGKRVLLEGTRLWKKLNFTKKMVWRNLMRNKKRVVFIAMGVSVTLLVVVVPIYLVGTMPEMFNHQFGQLQRMDYSVDFSRLTSYKSVEIIDKKINSELIEPKLEYPFEIENKWKSKIVSIIGLKKDTKMYQFEDPNENKIKTNKNFVFVSENLAKILDVDIGDEIKVNNYIPGKKDITLKVDRIIKQNLGTNIYMDIELMQEKLVEKTAINGVYINSNSEVKSKLDKVKYISEISSLEDLSSGFEEFMKITAASISAMLFFGFILGFAIMYNTTIMTINSRLLEFSSLRILGMSKGEIIGVILKENFVITIIGIIIGIPLSKYASEGIARTFSTDLYSFGGTVRLWAYIAGIIATIIFILIAQLAAYQRIRKLNFIEALKERAT